MTTAAAGRPGPGIRRRDRDTGSAVVEFCWLAVLLLVPLAYAVLAVFELQKAAYAVSSAAREAGRAFVTAASAADASDAALTAARIAAADHRLDLGSSQLRISCAPDPSCPLVPGQQVEIAIDLRVPLPLAPPVLAGGAPASVAVGGRHVEFLDRYRGTAR